MKFSKSLYTFKFKNKIYEKQSHQFTMAFKISKIFTLRKKTLQILFLEFL